MRAVLLRFALGCVVAGVSGLVDGLIIALASPEGFLEHWKMYVAVSCILGAKGALMWFKNHEGELTSAIDPRRVGGVVIVVGLLSAPGCTAAGAPRPQLAPVRPPAPAAQVVNEELAKAVDWTYTTVDIARTLQRVEIAAYRNGRVTDDAHRTIQTAYTEFAGTVEDAVNTALDLTKSEVTRWAAVRSVAELTLQLLERIDRLLPAAGRVYADSMKAVLSLLGYDA